MKKLMSVLLVALFISATVFVPTADAFESKFEGISYKLGRGLSNAVLSPFEIGISIDEKVNDHGMSAGIPIGIIHGIGRTTARVLTAAYDVATFLFPMPTYNSYYMEPEFVLASPK